MKIIVIKNNRVDYYHEIMINIETIEMISIQGLNIKITTLSGIQHTLEFKTHESALKEYDETIKRIQGRI